MKGNDEKQKKIADNVRRKKLEHILKRVCEDVCKWPDECLDEEELEDYCTTCPCNEIVKLLTEAEQ